MNLYNKKINNHIAEKLILKINQSLNQLFLFYIVKVIL